ncbi:adenylate/guanylate cyclase domain-containing protein [Chitinophaga tropicalis]|uniref:Adenylate/guanylate cyclase domain-containing protein n=1 Tax=Chitinophaga tropicalis TaxID=2683588 RepID=A0A7K1U4W5_9BACT|nr:adenylate/guanylate cyclase domain-containing protein [Chitinophaga tropicalis]MVT09404.1 adenylate/guanylate cyclase domain-containing protein [Chitinophaga tropicalis]
MNRRTAFKFRQLGLLTAVWLMIGVLIALYDHFTLHTHISAGPAADYSLPRAIVVNMCAALIGAILGGSLLVFFVNVKFRDKSYGYTIVTVIVAFSVIIILVNIILKVIAVAKPDYNRMCKNSLVWAIVVAVTQMALQVNSKFGYGIFWDIIRGKYNTPKEERRIFMFLDLNASTTIAEQLGDKQYHAFLKDYFSDMTNPILDNKGEIYQYAGDEVIVAWKYEDGIQNSKCIQCFFDIKYHLQTLEEKYRQRYGIVPSFKAGIHCGKVVAGEIGIIKRDITYSGDVLNTTSRIQGMCKQFNEEIIASADLVEELHLPGNFVKQTLGAIKLRGKEREMQLIALKPVI